MLEGALTFRASGVCPVQTSAQAKAAIDLQQRGAGDAAGMSLENSPVYQLSLCKAIVIQA